MNLNTTLPSSILLSFHTVTLPPCKTTATVPSVRRRFTFLRQHRHHHVPNFKIVRNSIQQTEVVKLLEIEEAELLLATCITRTLTPALTLELGLEKIKHAVEEMKLKPHCAKAGMCRFQVAVSPGSKALNWFCNQNPSLGVFPQFFVSTGDENSTNKSLSFIRTRGVFGIGAAVYIKTPYCSDSVDELPFKRCKSINPAHPMAYGLLGDSSSYYMFIPRIELIESDGLSILTATLAWDDSSVCVYVEAFDDVIYLTTGQPLQAPWQTNA